MTITKEVIEKHSPLLEAWKEEMANTMIQMEPDWDEEKIALELDKMLVGMAEIPLVTLDNNYTGETVETNLLSTLDWMIDRKPIIAGNGTFYKNQLEAINPIAVMLDGFLKARKATKKEMFKVEDKTSDRYFDLDRKQLNYKILANSYYGASGMPASAFYSKYSGPGVTSTAQSVISTTETFFESFLTDNYKFIDINEAFHYMNKIREQAYDVPDWIEHETSDNLFIRIRGMFYQDIYIDDYDEPLYKYITNLDQDDIDRIFYKNNFMEFIRRHEIMREKFNNLFEEVHNYEHVDTVDEIPLSFNGKFTGTDKEILKEYNSFVNHETFMDPNSPPDNLIDDLNELKDIVMKCVYMPFMSVDRIHRLKYFRRRTVSIVDTDSNILAVDLLVNFFKDEIMEADYGRNDETNAFIIINTLAYFITAAVSDTLFEYGKYSNIPEEHRFRFSMKNE